ASNITEAMFGRSWMIWAGVVSGQWDERASGMRKRSASGGECAGPPLKKSPKRRAHDHLYRRKWNKPAAASSPHLVASRRDSHSAIQLQLRSEERRVGKES